MRTSDDDLFFGCSGNFVRSAEWMLQLVAVSTGVRALRSPGE
jgi:hypothetical protein